MGKEKSKKRRRSSTSADSSSSSSSSDSEREKRKLRKLKKKLKKEQKRTEKLLKKKIKEEKKKMKKKRQSEQEDNFEDGPAADIPIELMEKSKAMAPMTKEEWEQRQSVIRRVLDEESGRYRLSYPSYKATQISTIFNIFTAIINRNIKFLFNSNKLLRKNGSNILLNAIKLT
ncbi:uncharacterized protein [Epargyreus clarus]|uniref:uncharacterized protein isoform X1 n=1 Tax=Epargyreus clarus TaxID=520877 RepID=UPI003C2FF428